MVNIFFLRRIVTIDLALSIPGAQGIIFTHMSPKPGERDGVMLQNIGH